MHTTPQAELRTPCPKGDDKAPWPRGNKGLRKASTALSSLCPSLICSPVPCSWSLITMTSTSARRKDLEHPPACISRKHIPWPSPLSWTSNISLMPASFLSHSCMSVTCPCPSLPISSLSSVFLVPSSCFPCSYPQSLFFPLSLPPLRRQKTQNC